MNRTFLHRLCSVATGTYMRLFLHRYPCPQEKSYQKRRFKTALGSASPSASKTLHLVAATEPMIRQSLSGLLTAGCYPSTIIGKNTDLSSKKCKTLSYPCGRGILRTKTAGLRPGPMRPPFLPPLPGWDDMGGLRAWTNRRNRSVGGDRWAAEMGQSPHFRGGNDRTGGVILSVWRPV